RSRERSRRTRARRADVVLPGVVPRHGHDQSDRRTAHRLHAVTYPATLPGVELSEAELAERIELLRTTPAWLRERLAGPSDIALPHNPAPAPAAFAPIEHAHHLADLERLGYSARLRRTLAEEHPFLADVDGTKLALERRYLELALEPALASFERERAA